MCVLNIKFKKERKDPFSKEIFADDFLKTYLFQHLKKKSFYLVHTLWSHKPYLTDYNINVK